MNENEEDYMDNCQLSDGVVSYYCFMRSFGTNDTHDTDNADHAYFTDDTDLTYYSDPTGRIDGAEIRRHLFARDSNRTHQLSPELDNNR